MKKQPGTIKQRSGTMKNRPGTMINHENRPGTTKNHESQPGTMKNHENLPGTMKNRPGTMKNHPRTMKNHENRPDTKKNQSGTMENYENPPLEQTNLCRLQTVKDHTAWLKILEQVTNTWIVKALTYLYSLLSVYVRYIQVQPGLIGGLWNQMGIKFPCDRVYIEVNRDAGLLSDQILPLGCLSGFRQWSEKDSIFSDNNDQQSPICSTVLPQPQHHLWLGCAWAVRVRGLCVGWL